MSVEKFTSYMMVIKKHQEKNREAGKALSVFAPSSFIIVEIGDELLAAYINLVEEKMGSQSGWIDWFIYENNWGKKKYEAGFKDRLKPIETIIDLYNLIMDVRE
jgi:hypothetical protein